MTTSARSSPWRPPLSLVAIAAIIWLVSFTPRVLSPYPLDPFRVTGQALLLILVIRAFCYWPPMIRWVAAMPIPHRLAFALLLGSMILGHYTINSRSDFPFITWFIFPSAMQEDPVTCQEFIATTQSGQKIRLVPEQLFPSLVQIDRIESFTPATTEHLARALARVYNSRHLDDPVRQIDLFTMAVQLHPTPGELRPQPSCELLKRYDISSGP